MIANKVPRYFWAEAVNTACYILNRAMIRPQLNKTSYELLRGRKPNISHLRVFGSKCFVLNNGKNLPGKFDPRSDEGMFVGYVPNSKAYKVFNKRTKVVEESIHVVFDEKPRKTLVREPEEDADSDEFLNLVREESDDEGEEPVSQQNQQTTPDPQPATPEVHDHAPTEEDPETPPLVVNDEIEPRFDCSSEHGGTESHGPSTAVPSLMAPSRLPPPMMKRHSPPR